MHTFEEDGGGSAKSILGQTPYRQTENRETNYRGPSNRRYRWTASWSRPISRYIKVFSINSDKSPGQSKVRNIIKKKDNDNSPTRLTIIAVI